jgi:hypothetical protein
MRIRQHAYLAVRSTILSVDEITASLGLDPDKVLVRGSKLADPPRPAANSWKLCSEEPRLTVDAHLGQLVERATPITPQLRAWPRTLGAQSSSRSSGASTTTRARRTSPRKSTPQTAGSKSYGDNTSCSAGISPTQSSCFSSTLAASSISTSTGDKSSDVIPTPWPGRSFNRRIGDFDLVPVRVIPLR